MDPKVPQENSFEQRHANSPQERSFGGGEHVRTESLLGEKWTTKYNKNAWYATVVHGVVIARMESSAFGRMSGTKQSQSYVQQRCGRPPGTQWQHLNGSIKGGAER